MPIRRVIVTGAASGIGEATARLHRDHGANVVGLDLTAGVDQLLAVDLTQPDAVRETINHAAKILGGLDVLVACAGISRRGTAEETEPSAWDELFAVNVRAAYLCARSALPYLRRGHDSAIINVASQFGLVATTGYVAYCASKAALIHLTRALAVDHGPEGIRVNVVCPGPTDTPMLRRDISSSAVSAREVRSVVNRTLHRRLSRPEEVAEVIEFLGSPGASSIHGAVVAVDAGYSIQ